MLALAQGRGEEDFLKEINIEAIVLIRKLTKSPAFFQ